MILALHTAGTQRESEARGEGQWHLGNHIANESAREAVQGPDELQAKEYMKQRRKDILYIKDAVIVLSSTVPRQSFKILERAVAGPKPKRGPCIILCGLFIAAVGSEAGVARGRRGPRQLYFRSPVQARTSCCRRCILPTSCRWAFSQREVGSFSAQTADSTPRPGGQPQEQV